MSAISRQDLLLWMWLMLSALVRECKPYQSMEAPVSSKSFRI